MNDKKRYYSFILVLYEQDKGFKKQFEVLKNQGKLIWIKHDKDIDEEGKKKKKHYHFVLTVNSACTINALAKRVGCKSNMIEPIKKSLNGCLKYLIHYNDDSQYQYSVEEVQSNDSKLFRKFQDLVTKDVPEVEKVMNIQEFILNYNDFIKFNVLGKYVQSINKWDAFRRNFMYFKTLVEEHNAEIYAKKYNVDSYGTLSSYQELDRNLKILEDSNVIKKG